jgi:DNA-binding transcriptional MocR family regulator
LVGWSLPHTLNFSTISYLMISESFATTSINSLIMRAPCKCHIQADSCHQGRLSHPTNTKMATSIDLFRGWPNPALLPVESIAKASSVALSTPSIFQPGLQYGPDEGYGPLRQHLADWLTSFYRPKEPISEARLCVTGGASQNLACVLQVFTDAAYTRNIWVVAPTYYLACRIFHDAGFMNRLRGVPEDTEGIDIDFLERGLQEAEAKANAEGNTQPVRGESFGLHIYLADGCSATRYRDRGAKFINMSST